MATYQGPVRPGTNEKVFRDTGKSTPSYQGPTRPGTDVEEFRRTGRSTGGSGGGRSNNGNAERNAQAAANAAAEAEKVKAEKAASNAQAEIARQAAEQKRNELIAVREQKIQEQMDRQRELGLLPTRESAETIVRVRENAEVEQARKEAAANAGATGEVTASPEKNVVEKVVSVVTRSSTRTKQPLREVLETQVVDGGVIESRIVSTQAGVPNTKLVFVPNGPGSERKPTPEEVETFRENQQRVTGVYRPEDTLQGLQFDVKTQKDIITTRNLRGDRPTGFQDIGEQIFIGGIGAGAATSLLGTASFVKDLVIDPTKTAKNVKSGIIQASGDLESGKLLSDVSTTIKTSPGFALGFAATEIATDVAVGQAADDFLSFAKRTKTRFSPDYRKVNVDVDTGIKSIKNVNDIGDIELIPPKGEFPIQTLDNEMIKNLPSDLKARAGFKGPYGFSADEIKKLTGMEGPVATSARDLFGINAPGKTDLLGKNIKVIPPGEYGDISLFVTPFDPTDLSVRTRISRLGTDTPRASFLDVLRGDVSFGGTPNPQIVVFPDETVGKNFMPIQFTKGELELTLFGERSITKTGKPGVTIIGKNPVDIITAKLDDVPVNGNRFIGFTNDEIRSFSGTSSKPVAGASTFSPLLIGGGSSSTTSETYNIGSSSSITLPITSTNISTIIRTSGGSSKKKSYGSSISKTSLPLPIISRPVSSKPSKNRNIPSWYNPYKSSSKISPLYKIFGGSSYGSISKPAKIISPIPFKLPKAPTYKQPRGLFGVQIRRGGKFFNIGTGSLKQVQALGQERTSKTLAATYKITGGNVPGIKLPKGYYSKKTKGGVEIIEKVGRRLKKGSGEIPEILRAKAKKKKSKRKKK